MGENKLYFVIAASLTLITSNYKVLQENYFSYLLILSVCEL